MAIAFEGDFLVPRTPEEVYEFLADPKHFGPLLPDFQNMTLHDDTHFTVKVRVGVSHIRGSAELRMERVEAVRPLRARYRGQGTVVGGQVKLTAGFDLNGEQEGTRVIWKGETQIYGKLASVAGGLLEPIGRRNIEKLIDGLQKALTGSGDDVSTAGGRTAE